MKSFTVAALAAAAVVLPTAASAQQTVGNPARLILTAEGHATGSPDMATVTAGVIARAPTASAAMTDQRTRMDAVMAALEEAGIEDSDIQTTSIELTPVYVYNERSGEQNIDGYQASNRVTVTAHDLTLVGPTLDALVAAGANDISNIAFGFEESDKLYDAARRDAVAKLRQRADLYADAADIQVGRILELSESGGYMPYGPIMVTGARLEAQDAAPPTPVSGGEMTLQISVTATYEIVQ